MAIPQDSTITGLLFCLSAGASVPCLSSSSRYALEHTRIRTNLYNRGETIRVVRVVVVDIATTVDIPRIVGVATIRGTQAHVLLYNLHPFKTKCFHI
jgi:hypothetical protein